jgi:MATE family, multidrug efflux pump
MTPGAALETAPRVATPADAETRGPATPPLKPGAARTRLLLEGPIVSTLLRLAAPNVVVNVVVIAVTATVDAYFVGRFDPGALAGLSLVFPLLMLMQQMANGTMGGAVASSMARALGAGRRDDASALVVHALVIAAGMATIFTSLLLIAGPTFYALMGGHGAMLAAALEYSNTIFAGAIVYWVLGALTSVVRGTGQPAVLAGVYAVAELLHLALVPALVFGIGPIPSLGITGAALATVSSFAIATIALTWYVASGRTAVTVALRDVRLSGRLFVDILHVGAPMSLQPILNNVSLATLTGFVGALGPAALAGFGAAVRLEYVLVPLTFGFGSSVQTMVGTNIGAGRAARAERITWIAGAAAAGVTGSIGVVAAVWPSGWVGLFNATPTVQLFAASYLCVVSLTYSFLGLGATLSSAFQATGRPRWPLLALVSRVLVVATGGWVAIHVLHAGLAGLGIVAAAGLIVYGSGLAIAFRSGAWKVPRMLSGAAAAVTLVVGVAAATPVAADEVQILSAAAMQSASGNACSPVKARTS